jgi:hypothetical protein
MRTAATILTFLLMAGCGTSAPIVSEHLDPQTGATVTHGSTPLILYRDDSARAAYARDFVYIGPLSVNRMGEYRHFLWLGIWSSMDKQDVSAERDGFESIVIFADGEPLRLELEGWTLSSIGVSEPVYNKPTATAADAYYPVTMDQIRLIASARDIRLRTGAPRSDSYEPWDSQARALSGMQAFVRYLTF